jgi:molybdopterin converting factor subunit 1
VVETRLGGGCEVVGIGRTGGVAALIQGSPARVRNRSVTGVRVVVRLFAILRERAGTDELLLDLPGGATVAAAAGQLNNVCPAIREHAKHVAYAVNREYARLNTVLEDGDELAIIPPVSGG